MANYRAIIEVDLEDDDSEPMEVQVIDEALFQAIESILGAAGYVMTGFKSIVLYTGDVDE